MGNTQRLALFGLLRGAGGPGHHRARVGGQDAYARALLGHLATPLSVEGRLQGMLTRRELLHQPGHEVRFVITPRVLAWNPDPATVSLAGSATGSASSTGS